MANVYQSRTKCNKDSTVLIVTHSGMLRRRTCHCILLISPPPKKKFFFSYCKHQFCFVWIKKRTSSSFAFHTFSTFKVKTCFCPQCRSGTTLFTTQSLYPPLLPHTEKGIGSRMWKSRFIMYPHGLSSLLSIFPARRFINVRGLLRVSARR